jgi:hypothetical protein
MSCSIQAHILALGWETTSPMAYWTQVQEDPAVATTWRSEVGVATWWLLHFSFVMILLNSFVDYLWWILIHCGALCWIAVHWVKYAGFLICGLFWRLPVWQPKHAVFVTPQYDKMGLLPVSCQRILDEARIHKSTHIEVEFKCSKS